MQERITEIEIKLAHLEQAVNELNDVIVQHSGLIDRLQRQSEQLLQQIDLAGAAEDKSDPKGEKPPHY